MEAERDWTSPVALSLLQRLEAQMKRVSVFMNLAYIPWIKISQPPADDTSSINHDSHLHVRGLEASRRVFRLLRRRESLIELHDLKCRRSAEQACSVELAQKQLAQEVAGILGGDFAPGEARQRRVEYARAGTRWAEIKQIFGSAATLLDLQYGDVSMSQVIQEGSEDEYRRFKAAACAPASKIREACHELATVNWLLPRAEDTVGLLERWAFAGLIEIRLKEAFGEHNVASGSKGNRVGPTRLEQGFR
ncbi:MAG: hypothetical protein M1838_004449 [Thelocarpon superellum]|nr:MAG: hypothetical protein M1838_004449 [Thelocarpon superellum]